jgi:3-oxoacyl-(acyl-carrier-protein) synthase
LSLRSTIVVTGRGVISAAGFSVESLWQRACAGESPAARLSWRNPENDDPFVACVVSDLPEVFRRARRMDRVAQLALAAAHGAWFEAQLDVKPVPGERVAILAATSRGPLDKLRQAHDTPEGRQLPSLVADTAMASLSGVLSMFFKAQGPCLTVSATCASAAAAIILGAQQLLCGEADLVLAGGAEAPLLRPVLEQFAAARLLGSHALWAKTCRPFDLTRNGTVLGEGAGFLVLETLESAQRRGVVPLAQLAGWAMGAEARERASVDDTGSTLARVVERSLAKAQLKRDVVGYINMHGTGTHMNDLSEARAIQQVFSGGRSPACSSTKPITGHCMGAGAGLEAIIAIEALRQQVMPVSANCVELDPECAIDLICGQSRAGEFQAAMSNSSGFWGNHASLVFQRMPSTSGVAGG